MYDRRRKTDDDEFLLYIREQRDKDGFKKRYIDNFKGKINLYLAINFIISFSPLTVAIRRPGYTFFVTLYHEPAVRIEHYLQIRTGGPDRTIAANWHREPAARMFT